jgi:hypothetical protein
MSKFGFLAFLGLLAIATSQSGCVTACGPGRCPPRQKVRLVTDSPTNYTIRVSPTHRYSDEAVDTSVGGDGHVEFDVPVYTPHCKQYLFGVIRLNPDGRPEAERRIRVMQGEKTIRKMSVDDIAKLPKDEGGFYTLKLRS